MCERFIYSIFKACPLKWTHPIKEKIRKSEVYFKAVSRKDFAVKIILLLLTFNILILHQYLYI